MTATVELSQFGMELEEAEPTQAEKDYKPWKYIGYPGFSAFVSSDSDTFAVRRFDELHCRILLRAQDSLTKLEEELAVVDRRLRLRAAEDIDNGSFRNDNEDRRVLLDKIHTTLKDYDDLLCRFIQLKARPAAPKINVRNMSKWLSNRCQPIHEKEVAFLTSSDLLDISKSSKTPVRRFFEQQVLVRGTRIATSLRTPRATSNIKPELGTTIHGSDESVDLVSAVSLFAIAFVMLIAPLWILAVLSDIFRKLAVITSFSTVFLGVMKWGTLAKPFEIFAATAGYCAVLVVFLQLGSNPSSHNP